MPTADEMAHIIESLDLGFQSSNILVRNSSSNQLQVEHTTIILWSSVFEIGIYCAAWLLFVVVPSQMWYVWMLALHVPRGLNGLWIVFKGGLPTSHEIIENMELTDPVDTNLDKVQDKIGESGFTLFGKAMEKSRNMLCLYTMLTVACYCLDGINFLIQYKNFGIATEERGEFLLLLVSLLFYVTDIFYLVWVVNLKDKLPNKLSKGVSDGMLGFTRQIGQQFKEAFKRKPAN